MNIFGKERRELKKEKRALKKALKKEKKANWKEYKKEKKIEDKVASKLLRESLKEEYKDAPALTKFFNVNNERIKKAVKHLAVIIIAATVAFFLLADSVTELISMAINDHIDKIASSYVDPEVLHALSPLDEEGSKRIDAIPGNNADDTWTFCVYMVGSNLEDNRENDLSEYVTAITEGIADENRQNNRTSIYERLDRYSSEINENGLDVPEYLYKIDKPVASSNPVIEEVTVTDEPGGASTDIAEMCANSLPENITIVVQTGGARRWSNALINPNKTQRFVIKNEIMNEVENIHIQDSCNPDTLADFISYCDKNYKSDHMGMILWDHGGGVTGFGVDMIYGSGMSLADLNTAFSKSLKKNVENPYFDFIGFDACLMASTDVAVALDGYGKYLMASEEVEPGDGWDHTAWLGALAEDPTLSAPAIGRAIADSYMDHYMKQNNDMLLHKLSGDRVVTFSVSDLHKAALVDAAYEKMNEKLLKLVIDNPSVLVDMSRAAKKTMRYAVSDYDYYNTIDLGTYVDYLSETYPDECEDVRRLLRDAVLYKRATSYHNGSQGLSIYFPASMEEAYSLYLFTDYVYNISNKPSTNALYFYKVAGCLNEEMQKHVEELTGKQIKALDTQMFYDYKDIMPEISSDNEIVINVGNELENSIQDVFVEIARYDEAIDKLTYYGTDDCYEYDGNGNIVVDVDGQWFAIDGSLLDANISFATDTTSTYIAKVLHNSVPSYMTFTMNNETGAIAINSVVKIPDPDKLEFDAALRSATELLPGDTIIPVLTKQSADGKTTYEDHGKKIKYKVSTTIELENLPDGDYVQSVVITDLRGDKYYSPVVEAQFKNGKASELKVNPYYVGQN